MGNIERWEVRGSHGTSSCDLEASAVALAADRARLYPELGPFEVVKVEYVPAEQLQGAVEENERLREAMVRCAEKLESWGNEEPVAVASYLRDHAAAGGERLGL